MKPFSQQLNPALVSKSRDLERFTSILNGILPPETRGHYHVTEIDHSTLVVITDSPVWTTRLRQLGPLIIKALSDQAGLKLQHVKIISRQGPIKPPHQGVQTVNRVLSEKSGQQLSQAAEYIQNQALKQALLKLSERSKK